MKTIITHDQVARFTALKTVFAPDDVRTIQVKHPLRTTESNFRIGCRLHSLFERIADHGPLSRREKALLPWMTSLRNELRSIGVRFIEPEVAISDDTGFPSGRCDLLVHGGPAAMGVIEIKVTDASEPSAASILQLGGYLSLVDGLRERGARDPWGAIAHASMREGCWRLFVFRHTDGLRNAACELLAA